MSREDIRKVCDVLFYPGQVVEIRALGDHGTQIGYYSNWDRLTADVDTLDGSAGFKGIYCTLNPVNPALLARKANRISKQGKTDAATTDGDIIRRRWLPVDIDPKRPSGISSSDDEHEMALDKARKIQGFLSELGWPEPVFADSGNGAHLLYRIDMPNNGESGELVKTCLTVLSQFFNDVHSDVDLSVFNPARIWKFYGTVSRKGDNTEDRPHRRSEIVTYPDDILVVPVSELMHLASLLGPTEKDNSGPGGNGKINGVSTPSSIDLSDWLMTHGMGYTEKAYSGGRLFVLDECPFSSAHKDGAYAIQFDNGAIFAGCHHNSCGGGEQRWSELREMHEGTRPKRDHESRLRQISRDRAEARAEFYGDRPKDSDSYDQPGETPPSLTPDIATQASRILREGQPIQYILDSYALDHEGDDVVAKCLIMSFASRSVLNSNGLHVLVTGESGKGKSHAFDTMIQHIPPEYRLDGRMSDKALFYAEDLRAGSAICLDDVALSEQMQETLKGVTTSFKKPFIYRTVNKDRKGQTCVIPERCVWWVAKMEGTGDDQVWNRMLTAWIDDSSEQDEKVLARELAAAESLPTESPGLRDEVLVCHQIWHQMKPVHVVIPYAKRIRFSSSSNRRNPGMLLDLIKSIACLHQHQRDRDEVKEKPVIYANVDDFRYACQMYQALNGESGGQMTKLTRSEAELIKVLRNGKQEWTVAELSKITGSAEQTVRKQICGYNSYGKNYSGLLEKCPAISYLDRTEVENEGRTSRRCMVFVWDDEVYQLWSSGGGCWLEGTHSPGEEPDDDDSDEGGRAGEKPQRAGSPALSNSPDEPLESKNNDNNKNIFYKDTLGRENQDVYGVKESADLYTTAVRSPALTDQNPPDMITNNSDSRSEGENLGRGLPTSPAQSVFLPPSSIDPDDFSSIDGVWSGPCAVCGGKWVSYTEKFSAKMKAEGRFSHKICQKCYSKAVARVSMSFMALPGTINTSVMVPADKDYGRCKICDLGGVAWFDHETKTGICSICYTRERGRTGVMV